MAPLRAPERSSSACETEAYCRCSLSLRALPLSGRDDEVDDGYVAESEALASTTFDFGLGGPFFALIGRFAAEVGRAAVAATAAGTAGACSYR